MQLSVVAAAMSALAVLGTGTGTSGTGENPPQPDLNRYYTQRIAWAPCQDRPGGTGEDMSSEAVNSKVAQCGQLTVPLDYANPAGRTLNLALYRIKSTGKPRGSVLVNFGGPGIAGVAGLSSSIKKFGDLSKGYDVVSFDPRGVARSSPVTCDGATTPDPTNGGRIALTEALKNQREAGYKCVKNSGPVLAHIGTINVSRDLDVMRQSLGDDKLNYLGFSYGTRLGAVYAAQFPEKTGRMVLDGVDTLTDPPDEQHLAVAEGLQTAFDRFIDWCVDTPGCVLGSERRAAHARAVKLINDMDVNPLEFEGMKLSGQDVANLLSDALYYRSSWPAVSLGLASLITYSDPRPLQDLHNSTGASAGRDITVPSKIPDDNAESALVAVNCADASPVFGKSMLAPLLMCYDRPAGTRYIRDEVRNVDTPKILLVGTRGDPATPYRWAQETTKRLGSSAVLLDNQGDGHIGYMNSKCVKGKVNAFLLYRQTPSNGSSCAAD